MADAERQLQVEGAQRTRVGACAVVAGLLFFGGQVLITLIGAKEKSIGVLQGLAPAFNGQAAARVDPRTVHEQFLVHYQWSLIGGFVISCVGVLLMIFPLRYLGAAEQLRSNAPSPIGRYAAIAGPAMYGAFLPAFEISLILGAHSYLSGHARTGSAIDAATGGGLRVAFQLILTIGTLLLAVAFIMVSLRSMRVGLLTRMMGTVGIIAGVLFLIPITPLPVIQALWLIFVGAMFVEFGRRPLPEAWRVATAVPWPAREPSARQQRQRGGGGLLGGGAGMRRRESAPAVPAPTAPRGPSPSASKKRKRRR